MKCKFQDCLSKRCKEIYVNLIKYIFVNKVNPSSIRFKCLYHVRSLNSFTSQLSYYKPRQINQTFICTVTAISNFNANRTHLRLSYLKTLFRYVRIHIRAHVTRTRAKISVFSSDQCRPIFFHETSRNIWLILIASRCNMELFIEFVRSCAFKPIITTCATSRKCVAIVRKVSAL